MLINQVRQVRISCDQERSLDKILYLSCFFSSLRSALIILHYLPIILHYLPIIHKKLSLHSHLYSILLITHLISPAPIFIMVKSEHLSFPCEVGKEKEVDGIFSNHHGLPRNIPVSDGVPAYTPHSCTDEGLAYWESARTLHTQPSLDEGSTTIQGDTSSSSRLKGKFFLGCEYTIF
jgi:hypothetical protein